MEGIASSIGVVCSSPRASPCLGTFSCSRSRLVTGYTGYQNSHSNWHEGETAGQSPSSYQGLGFRLSLLPRDHQGSLLTLRSHEPLAAPSPLTFPPSESCTPNNSRRRSYRLASRARTPGWPCAGTTRTCGWRYAVRGEKGNGKGGYECAGCMGGNMRKGRREGARAGGESR